MHVTAILVLFILYIWSLYNLPVIAVGVRDLLRTSREVKKASRSEKRKSPTFTIIIPAKDEEKVLSRLLDSLLKVNYPPQKKEIIVVEDGSVDKTVGICERYSSQFPNQLKLLLKPESNGKPSALNYALKHATGEIIAVLDADSVLEPDALSRLTKHFEDQSIAAVQGRACSINADENMLTRLVSYEETVRYETYIRGKAILKLFVPLTG
ncbi:MAG: glycosyltransferase family 2 protein, partial [Candidatus Bathyarchaeota archaeon]